MIFFYTLSAFTMALKANLIKLMKEKGLTINDLASKTDISIPTLKRLRTRDDVNPTLDILLKLSKAFDLEISELIQEEISIPIFYQDKTFSIAKDISEFILVFTRNTFNFLKGTRAVFKKYRAGDKITKYILNKEGNILEKINEEKMLFQDENFINYQINSDLVLAYIVKEIYEVNYV